MLSGIVEMDETYIGGKERNKPKHKRIKGTQGRSTKTKVAVVGIRSRDGKVKASSMERVNSYNINKRIERDIEKGSILCTDGATVYNSVSDHYEHLRVNHSIGEYVRGIATTNGIESVWSVLKRGYHGTFHHFSRKHTDRYVNEFTFRLNNCGVKLPTMERIDNILKNTRGRRLRYSRLIAV